MSYEAILRRLLGLACLLAPMLQIGSALLYLAGNLAWEAVVGMYAWTLSVMMYQGVALMIGQRKPVYGAVVAIIGFLNAAGVAAYAARMAGVMMVELGLFENQAQIWDLPSVVPAFMAYGLLGLMAALTPAISAVGLFLARATSPWMAGALLASTICFLLAQVGEVAYGVTYPLYGLLMLVGFAPVGLALLRGEPGAVGTAQAHIGAHPYRRREVGVLRYTRHACTDGPPTRLRRSRQEEPMLKTYRSAIAPLLIGAGLLAALLVIGVALGTLVHPSSAPALRTSPHPLLAPPAIAERAAPASSQVPLAPAPIALPARRP